MELKKFLRSATTQKFLSMDIEIQDVGQTYLEACDAAQGYKINVKTSTIKESSKTVIGHANLLQSMYQELDLKLSAEKMLQF